MKKHWRELSFILILAATSCIDRTQEIDYIGGDYQLTTYQYFFSDDAIIKTVHSNNSQIILYGKNYKKIEEIESFNFGAFFISDFNKKTIHITFLVGKSEFYSFNFLNIFTHLDKYKIRYDIPNISKFTSDLNEEIIDSINFENRQFRVRFYRRKRLIDDVKIQDVFFNNKEIVSRFNQKDSIFYRSYSLTNSLTPQTVLNKILDEYKKKSVL